MVPAIDETIYEFPLHEWHDVAGSKLRPLDMVKAFFGLVAIRWSYGRSVRPKDRRQAGPIPGKPHAVIAPTSVSITGAR